MEAIRDKIRRVMYGAGREGGGPAAIADIGVSDCYGPSHVILSLTSDEKRDSVTKFWLPIGNSWFPLKSTTILIGLIAITCTG